MIIDYEDYRDEGFIPPKEEVALAKHVDFTIEERPKFFNTELEQKVRFKVTKNRRVIEVKPKKEPLKETEKPFDFEEEIKKVKGEANRDSKKQRIRKWAVLMKERNS